ncbi:MAG: peptidoglycan DD-metalloendopeptidase family protein [Chloroflexi bacterium]|nr:peptidoglycan DD-metalloendopeptidase family protein [Chloroflexota bacterium]
MDNKPLQEFPQQNEEKQGETSEQRPSLVTRWMERLAHLGLGEVTLRIGTNVLAVLLIVTVVWLLQQANLGETSSLPSASNLTPLPTLPVSQLPAEIASALDGIPRQAQLHTTIPSRPRMDVATYTVQAGDSIFRIADNFGLKPSTILFGNWNTLRDHPNLLKPGQELNILPVDGTYYEWQGTESLTKVAEVFGVDTESMINFPGNHLDPDAIGDLNNPNIAAGTWLIVPGGKRQFTSWTAPAQLVQSNPSTHVWGPGVCSGISFVQPGYGTFVYPTTEHWLSGTPYRPDIRHFAVDFAGAQGNGVFAADAGTVVYAGWNDWGYGNLVIIDHGNGWQSLYAHLSSYIVQCGQNVGQGELIGGVGMTGGTSTGPHLHFELMNTTYGYVNPLDYLPAP